MIRRKQEASPHAHVLSGNGDFSAEASQRILDCIRERSTFCDQLEFFDQLRFFKMKDRFGFQNVKMNHLRFPCRDSWQL